MDLSCTVSEINGDFGRKSQIFPTASVFNAKVFVPLEFSSGGIASKTRPCLQSDGENSLAICAFI